MTSNEQSSQEKQELPRLRSRGSGTETCYSVEARYDFPSPIQVAGQIFDNRWREVKFVDSEIGVPRASELQEHTIRHRMLGYSAAQALRWWLHAIADTQKGGMCLCLETRIVKHTIKYSHEIEAISEHDHIKGDDRSNCIPDWKKAISNMQRQQDD